ncbi:MAG: hypothetical protein RL757_2964 [Bacteroidota bacterium]|jgi:uncharacterized protein (DUF1800 family)
MSNIATKTAKRTSAAAVAGLTPYTGTFGREQIIHLLKRTMFGAKPSDVAFFETRTLQQTLDILLAPSPVPATTPVKHYFPIPNNTTTADPDPNITPGTAWVNDIWGQLSDGGRRESLKSWWIGQMVNQDRNIIEKMVLFWHNHFATELSDGGWSNEGYFHHLKLREFAMGNLKQFVRAITLDPHMLRYLNGRANRKTAPDENYARELQELFCVGKGAGSGYTEDDVKAAARLLTGFNIVNTNPTALPPVPQPTYSFTLGQHDTTAKQFSAFYGNRLIAGRNTATAGEDELTDLLDMIFATSEVAKFICRKLYTYFVYYDITPIVETTVIEPLADLFRQNGYQIRPIVETLLKSDHFFEVGQKGCVIKSPMDFVVGAVREFGNDLSTSDYTQYYSLWRNLVSQVSNQGQNLGDPPNVAGWQAYYQIPLFHEMWINTDTLPTRMKWMNGYLGSITLAKLSQTAVASFVVKPDFLGFTSSFGTNAAATDTLTNSALQILYRMDVTQRQKDVFKAILENRVTTAGTWAALWATYVSTPTNTVNTTEVYARLLRYYRAITTLPEYQLS